MADWEVKVITESNYIKTVRVNDCFTRQDAENQALSSTGASRVVISTPKTYNDTPEVVENHNYSSQQTYTSSHIEKEDDDEKYYEKLDKMEEEMYDLMCKIALEEGDDLPTIQEFYEYIGKE